MNASPDVAWYELIKRVAFGSEARMRYKYLRIREEVKVIYVLLHLSLFLCPCTHYFLGQNIKRKCKTRAYGSLFACLS